MPSPTDPSPLSGMPTGFHEVGAAKNPDPVTTTALGIIPHPEEGSHEPITKPLELTEGQRRAN